MCGAQCLRTSRQEKLGRTSGGRTRGRLKLVEIESKGFRNRLETRTRRQTGQRLQSKRAKSCNTNRCACHSRQLTCNDRKRPPSIVRAGCAKALCWGAKGKRGLEVPGLAAHGIIDNLQLVFPELGRAAECPKECSKQKAAIPGTNQANSSPGKCSEQYQPRPCALESIVTPCQKLTNMTPSAKAPPAANR